jgi:hypothetical protein
MNSKRDRFTEAKACFELMKQETMLTGAVITIAAIAKRTQIDRKYFYGNINTPDSRLREKWIALGKEISSYKLVQKQIASGSEEPSDGDKLKNAIVENYGLVEQVKQSDEVRDRLKTLWANAQQKVDELEDHVRRLEGQVHIQSVKSPVVAFNARPTVISPDALRTGEDSLSMKKAWLQALKQLKAVVDTPNKKNVYITIGAPGSGKSTWSSTFTSSNCISVIFDACNLTRSDRYELFDIIRENNRIHVVAVVFCVVLETLEARNSKRISADKLPVEKLRTFYGSIEYPSLFDEHEMFDEILMLRG